ncbi:MAG: ATP synthase F1 subunit delta [Phycisphaerales bacterium]|nr:ATP synthase F1 subunit delta [Phycisphaerales bacterium]
MPLIETKPDALAKVYAHAVFDVAETTDGTSPEGVLGQLEDLLEIARDNRGFNELLASRLIDSGKRDASLVRMLEGKCDDLTLNFLRQLNAKGRLGHLIPIVGALDEFVQARFGRIEVDIFTASPMSPDALDSIKHQLNESLGKETILHPYTDSTMLGGIKIRMGDQLIDASVQADLRSLRDNLLKNGGAKVRGQSNDLLDN